jgi:hypothetical protein
MGQIRLACNLNYYALVENSLLEDKNFDAEHTLIELLRRIS